MWTLFEQIIILLILVAIGYTLGKTGTVNQEQAKALSTLLVYVFLPCNVLNTFISSFNVEYISKNWYAIAISSAIVIVLAISAHFISKLFTRNKYERSIFEYSLTVPNYGYMGYPIAQTVFGTAGLMYFMTMGLPLQIYIYTVGYAILTKQGLHLKKLINPIVIATVVGMILGLLEAPMPSLVDSVLDTSSACMAPVSMILTGLVISEFKLKEISLNPRIYPVIALKLLVIPIAIGLILRPFCDAWMVSIAVLLFALPCGMNTVIFPKLVGEDCKSGAGIALVSALLSAISMPLIFWIFGIG